MKRIFNSLLLIIPLIGWLTSKAQTGKGTIADNKLRSILKFEVSFYIGPTWEQRIGKNSSLHFLAGMDFGLQADKFDLHAPWIIIPTTKLQYRYYYNFKKRVAKNKKTRNNSANFLFGTVQELYPIKNQNYFGLLFIQGWGLQRAIKKHIGIEFRTGIIEHVYYDKPPAGGFNYIRFEPEVMTSIYYAF